MELPLVLQSLCPPLPAEIVLRPISLTPRWFSSILKSLRGVAPGVR